MDEKRRLHVSAFSLFVRIVLIYGLSRFGLFLFWRIRGWEKIGVNFAFYSTDDLSYTCLFPVQRGCSSTVMTVKLNPRISIPLFATRGLRDPRDSRNTAIRAYPSHFETPFRDPQAPQAL